MNLGRGAFMRKRALRSCGSADPVRQAETLAIARREGHEPGDGLAVVTVFPVADTTAMIGISGHSRAGMAHPRSA